MDRCQRNGVVHLPKRDFCASLKYIRIDRRSSGYFIEERMLWARLSE